MKFIPKAYLKKCLLGTIWPVLLHDITAISIPDMAMLSKTQQLIEKIKKDGTNTSLTHMVDHTVMKFHSLSSHQPRQPYFYTDNRLTISDIIIRVLEHPDGVIDETSTSGFLKIYREFNYLEDIRVLFIKEKKTNNSEEHYLGETPEGPTNQVVVVLKASKSKTDPEKPNLPSFSSSNWQYVNAYPVRLEK